MTQIGSALVDSLRPCKADNRRKQLSWFPMLALLAAIAAPMAAQAGAPNPLCAGCHSEDGNSVVPDFPKIAGLDPAYITKQIIDFKKFKRVSEVMGPMASQITDAEIPALAEYFSSQKRSPGEVTDKNLAAQGQIIYTEGLVNTAVPACSGCHGEKGEGTDVFPRLAGQHAAYLNLQLNNFKNEVRNNDARKVMRAIAKRMSEAEMKAAAEYITSLKGE
jgi:cytochrome c553